METANEAVNSQFLLNCTNFTHQELKNINLARGVSGSISLLLISLILSLLLAHKAYKTTLQRLFLYCVIIVLILEVTFTVQVEHYFHYSGQERVCKVVGFLSQYTASVLVTFVNEIVVYLIYISYYRLKGREHPSARSVCLKLSLEWILVSIAVLLPLAFTWSPLVQGNYGLNGAVCGIRSFGENCETSGFWDQVVLAVFSYLGSVTVLVSTIALLIMYCRMTYHYHHVQSPHTKKLLQHTLLLSGLVTIAFMLPVLLSLLYIAVSLSVEAEVYAVWLSTAAGTPFSVLLTPASFLVFTYTTRTTKVEQNNRHTCSQCCLKLLGRHTHTGLYSATSTNDTSWNPLQELNDTYCSTQATTEGRDSTESSGRQEDSQEQPLVANTSL